uniref:NADH-ubiquinone oxidoreductase chain 4L n=1 Tax=Gammarus duebeni TaxID=178002 RepID=H9M5R8_9CRUS|nr:NADH dehydrogenase subunit 4L [Gammarus duebeni]AER12197.1 NADH dehydrogenase subunit 4L [Gammarus duebeni]
MMHYMSFSVVLGLGLGLFSFVMNYTHLLNSLLSLEFLALMIYWSLSMSVMNIGSDFFFALFFLVMAVCEGVLGLSLLISGAYSHGSDYMKTYSSLSC